MESGNRNSQGRFVSGHKGAKPKGAINKSTRDYLAYLDKISSLLEANLPVNINNLTAKDQVMLWFEIEKFKHLKLSKFTEPEPEKEQISRITFQVVDSAGNRLDTPGNSPTSPPDAVLEQHSPVQAPLAENAPILYGAIDEGRVRRPNHFKRISRF